MRQLGIPNIYDSSHPEEGFVRFKDFKPDILFIDWSPGFDGLDLVQAVRRGENTPDPFAAIIMVSAFTESHHIKEARDAGASEYLAKPISAQRFYDRIVAVIENKRKFIRVEAFFGPDRHRLKRPYSGEERRTENRPYSENKPRTETQKSDKTPNEEKSDADNSGNESSS